MTTLKFAFVYDQANIQTEITLLHRFGTVGDIFPLIKVCGNEGLVNAYAPVEGWEPK